MRPVRKRGTYEPMGQVAQGSESLRRRGKADRHVQFQNYRRVAFFLKKRRVAFHA